MTDGCLDGHLKLLTRDNLLQFLNDQLPTFIGKVLVNVFFPLVYHECGYFKIGYVSHLIEPFKFSSFLLNLKQKAGTKVLAF